MNFRLLIDAWKYAGELNKMNWDFIFENSQSKVKKNEK